MRFALLGEHIDGLDVARALVASGRHELATYSGGPTGADALRRGGIRAQIVADLEEVLADPTVEAVIVAGALEERAYQLRRALQSERHVLCVHPPDDGPELAYEAAMVQGDTGCVLLPLMPESLHPGILRLRELATDQTALGILQLVEMERCAAEPVLIDAGLERHRPSLPGWDLLRALGGEIAEVVGFATAEALSCREPALLSGRFEARGLFQARYLTNQPESSLKVRLVGTFSRAELSFPAGWPGPARLVWRDESGACEQSWDAWNPWTPVVAAFDLALARQGAPRPDDMVEEPPTLTWQTAIRSLELDDAVRRSVLRRRVSALEYPEATEEVGFKGTMTLVGCGLLWAIFFLLILAMWFPRLGWLILPLLLSFLGLQILRWLVPHRHEDDAPTTASQSVSRDQHSS
jgi:predicted dehydrogenase